MTTYILILVNECVVVDSSAVAIESRCCDVDVDVMKPNKGFVIE